MRHYKISPSDFGFEQAPVTALMGGDAKQNAGILLGILSGETGPRRHVVLLNAAAALIAAGKVEDFAAGIALAAKTIDSGAALGALERLRRIAV